MRRPRRLALLGAALVATLTARGLGLAIPAAVRPATCSPTPTSRPAHSPVGPAMQQIPWVPGTRTPVATR